MAAESIAIVLNKSRGRYGNKLQENSRFTFFQKVDNGLKTMRLWKACNLNKYKVKEVTTFNIFYSDTILYFL